MDRAADNHYPTSALEVIKSRDVASIAADDCVLFLWATAPMLPLRVRGHECLGFRISVRLVWLKDRNGTGYWNRNAHEQLLIGMRGNVPRRRPTPNRDSVVEAPVGEHSAKPQVFLEMVEREYTQSSCAKIELNCRGPAPPGMGAWGNEAEDRGRRMSELPIAPEGAPLVVAEGLAR